MPSLPPDQFGDAEAFSVLEVFKSGLNTARYPAQDALRDTDCKVVQAMRTVGMTNAALKFEFPLTVRLEDKVRIGTGDVVERLP